jgi:hypothetical protein
MQLTKKQYATLMVTCFCMILLGFILGSSSIKSDIDQCETQDASVDGSGFTGCIMGLVK